MSGNQGPDDPLTQMGAAATATHELFTSLVGAGFDRCEALWLTAALTKGVGSPPAPGGA